MSYDSRILGSRSASETMEDEFHHQGEIASLDHRRKPPNDGLVLIKSKTCSDAQAQPLDQ